MATYYVSVADGLDTNTGLSSTPGAPGGPWQTIAKVNGSSFSAGDSILFKKGETWREQLTVPSSGSAGNVITFGAYGSGADPVLNGSDLLTIWTQGVSVVSDNFDDNNMTGWNVSGNVAASGAICIATVENGGADTANQVITSATELWMRLDFKLVSTGLNWANTNLMQGFGLYSSTSPRLLLGIYNSGGTPVWRTRYQNDSAEVDNTTATAITMDVWYDVLLHWKSATGAGLNNGMAEMWVTPADGSTVKILDNTAVDSDTLTLTRVYVGNHSCSAGVVLMTLNFDNVRVFSSAAGANLWTIAVTTEPYSMFFNNALGTYQSGGVASLVASKDWYWASNVLYVYETADPSTLYSSPGVEGPIRNYGVSLNAKTYVTVSGLSVAQPRTAGIYINGANNTVQGNSITRAYSRLSGTGSGGNGLGIKLDNVSTVLIDSNTVSYGDWGIGVFSSSGGTAGAVTCSNNIVHDIYFDGITSFAGNGAYTTGLIFERNTGYNLAQHANGLGALIHVNAGATGDTGTGNIVRYNKSYNNGTASITGWAYGADATTKNVTFSYNLAYGSYTCAFGIGCQNGGIVIENNTCYNNSTDATAGEIYLWGSAANVVIKNNIFYASAGGRVLQASAGALVGHTIDYNLYYGGSATPFKWGADSYNFTDYKTTTSQDAHSLNVDPKVVSTSTPDLHLKSGSPCINAGVSVGLTSDYEGNIVPVGTIPDIGAYEYQTTKPQILSMRGLW